MFLLARFRRPSLNESTGFLAPGFLAFLAILAQPVLAQEASSTDPAESLPTIEFEIDATRLGTQLLESRLVVPTPSGSLGTDRELILDYPLYIPGIHTSGGPIQSVAGLEIHDCDDNRLEWNRDPLQLDRIRVTVPEGCESITVGTTFITSQPSVNSGSIDSYGWEDLGVVSFNTIFWAPGERSHQDIRFKGQVRLPARWTSVGISLPHEVTTTDSAVLVTLDEATLAEFVDAPLVAGRNSVRLELDLPGHPPHTFTTFSKELSNATPPDWMKEGLEKMVLQGIYLMGDFPRRRFDFLYVLAPGINVGLEHGESTLIGDPEETLVEAVPNDEIQAGGASISVIPHEYTHAWVGKLRAPEGLVPPTFNEPINSELLWVYEGMTSYIDELIAVRSSWINFDEFRHRLLGSILGVSQKQGRLWRSLEDTARESGRLRARSKRWGDLRRRQDYYSEGSLFWLEADLRIRRGTQGERSLNDFIRRFYDVPALPIGAISTYDRQEIVDTLTEVYDGEDWSDLIRRRIELPVESLSMDYLLELLGYQIEWSDEATDLQKALAKDEPERLNLRTSLGMTVDEGKVANLVPGGLADEAGLTHDTELVGVNGWRYSKDRLQAAVEESTERGTVELLLDIEGQLREVTLTYDGGPRFPQLVPANDAMDLLADIAQPLEP